ncbi:MAG: hypothetical protein MUF78_11935 [Candidatus Edwardsbacteria bacterium]|nr:hypothetical protein [Candidatus Edwardsbacteria bacterium]
MRKHAPVFTLAVVALPLLLAPPASWPCRCCWRRRRPERGTRCWGVRGWCTCSRRRRAWG